MALLARNAWTTKGLPQTEQTFSTRFLALHAAWQLREQTLKVFARYLGIVTIFPHTRHVDWIEVPIMPLDKQCSQAAVQKNYSTLYGEGYRNPQLSAIVLSTLKKACGVDKASATMTADQIIGSAAKKEHRRWVDLSDLFEELPSSPAVRGLSFGLPGGMRGVGTSPSASPPSGSRGLAGLLGSEATNLANGMRMSPLVGGKGPRRCRGCGAVMKKGERCPVCGLEV